MEILHLGVLLNKHITQISSLLDSIIQMHLCYLEKSCLNYMSVYVTCKTTSKDHRYALKTKIENYEIYIDSGTCV